MRRSIMATIVLAVVLAPLGVSAYTLHKVWRDRTVKWRLSNPGFNDIGAGSIAQQNAAIQAGATEWNLDGCSPFRFQFDGMTSTTAIKPDGENIVTVTDLFGFGALATASIWWRAGTDSLTDFDIAFHDGATFGIPSSGTSLTGGGVAIGSVIGSGTTDIVVTAIDENPSGHDYWRVRIGSGCNGPNGCMFTSGPNQDFQVAAGGAVMHSSSVSLFDMDGDGRDEVLIAGVDEHGAGHDYIRYRILSGCTTTGCTESPIRQRHLGGSVLAGGGVAMGDVDSDGKVDIVFASIDQYPGGHDYWRYEVGFDCKPDGTCASFSGVQTHTTGGAVVKYGGVDIGDVDNDGNNEVVFSGIDVLPGGNDYWRVAVGDCNASGCNIASTQSFPGDGTVISGGGVKIADVDNDGFNETVVTGLDNWNGLDYWRFRLLSCTPTGCVLKGTVQQRSSGGSVVTGGGVDVTDINGDGSPELVLAGIDNWDKGPDYWRVAIGTGCSGGACSWGNRFSAVGAPGSTSIESVAVHEFGHAAGIHHSNRAGSTMVCNASQEDLSCDDVHAIQQLYSTQGVCGTETVDGPTTGGAVVEGGHVVVTDVDDDGRDDLVTAAVDHVDHAHDYWRVGYGTRCSRLTGICQWAVEQVPADGSLVASPSIAAYDIVADFPGEELIISGVDQTIGDDYMRYRVRSCFDGSCTWGPIQIVALEGAVLEGGGIAVNDIDRNGQADFLVAAIDKNPIPNGNDYWRYRIGFDCDAAGACANWTGINQVSSGVRSLVGGGVVADDLDGDRTVDVAFAAVQQSAVDFDNWRVALGTNCTLANGGCTITTGTPGNEAFFVAATSDFQANINGSQTFCGDPPGLLIPDLAVTMRAGSAALAMNNGARELLVSAVDEGLGADHDFFRHVRLNCDVPGGICVPIAAPSQTSSGASILTSGAIAPWDFNRDGTLDAVLVGVDGAEKGLDYWRIRVRTGACGI